MANFNFRLTISAPANSFRDDAELVIEDEVGLLSIPCRLSFDSSVLVTPESLFLSWIEGPPLPLTNAESKSESSWSRYLKYLMHFYGLGLIHSNLLFLANGNHFPTWSYILSSKRYTVHRSHLSKALASVMIVLTRRSKLICSWNKLRANESKS